MAHNRRSMVCTSGRSYLAQHPSCHQILQQSQLLPLLSRQSLLIWFPSFHYFTQIDTDGKAFTKIIASSAQ